MKKLLLGSAAFLLLSAGVALAADMPTKGPVYKAAEPIYDWSGLYVGVYSGVGVQRSRGFDPTGAFVGEVKYIGAGFAGGATAGYNWQFNRNWVVGIEGDIGYLGLSHNTQDWNDFLLSNSKTSWIGTLRGRAGYSSGPTLNYITAGGAWLQAEDSISNSVNGVSLTSSKTFGGYTIGTGVETMLGGNWTAKAETSFVDVGRGATLGPLPGGYILQTDKHRYEMMKFGLNYLFGGKQPALMTHNWSGFYAGVAGGTAVADARGAATGAAFGQVNDNSDGLTVGGMAGYNLQFAPSWVAGVEGDFSYLGIKHSTLSFNDGGAVFGVKTNWLGTVRGRIGYSTGPALLYVTGGAAWTNLQDRWGAEPVSLTTTRLGGTFGGGIETILSGNWTSKTEYLYVDAKQNNTLFSPGTGASIHFDHTAFHVFRSGLTYHFSSQ